MSPQKYETMQLRASLSDRTPYRKFLIVVGLTLIGAVFFTAIGTLLSQLIFGINLTGDASILDQTGNAALVNNTGEDLNKPFGADNNFIYVNNWAS